MPNGSFDGHIKALPWELVDQIIGAFNLLNPYDRSAVPGSILKCEKDNFEGKLRRQLHCYAISAKRYSLFTKE